MSATDEALEALRAARLPQFTRIGDVLAAGPHVLVHGDAQAERVVACHDRAGERLAQFSIGDDSVTAWAACARRRWLLIALDDQLELRALPGLEVLARGVFEAGIEAICLDSQLPRALVAVGVQGNYRTHGNLLLVDLPALTGRPLLACDREVVACERTADGRVRFVLGWPDESDDTHEEGWLASIPDAPAAPGRLRRLSPAEVEAIDRRVDPPTELLLARLRAALAPVGDADPG